MFHSSRYEEYPDKHFSYFSMKTYSLDLICKFAKVILMSTQHVCFDKDVRKITALCGRKKSLVSQQQIRRFFHPKNADIFLTSPRKHMLWYSLKVLGEALLMSTHNICFRGEIRKILCGYPFLSVAMQMSGALCFHGASRKI